MARPLCRCGIAQQERASGILTSWPDASRSLMHALPTSGKTRLARQPANSRTPGLVPGLGGDSRFAYRFNGGNLFFNDGNSRKNSIILAVGYCRNVSRKAGMPIIRNARSLPNGCGIWRSRRPARKISGRGSEAGQAGPHFPHKRQRSMLLLISSPAICPCSHCRSRKSRPRGPSVSEPVSSSTGQASSHWPQREQWAMDSANKARCGIFFISDFF